MSAEQECEVGSAPGRAVRNVERLTRSLERMRSGHVSCQSGRAGPPASLSSVVRRHLSHVRSSTRHVVALLFGLATWWLCFHVSSEAAAQTGYPPPVEHEVYREAFRWLWFPFKWIPTPQPLLTGSWQQSARLLLIGVPYGFVVGVVVPWLFRQRQRKI